MISPELLKEVLVGNERFITEEMEKIIPREYPLLPAGLRKVGVFYGVRRSGKTYLLFDLFKQNPGRSLYLDFEDERLEGFETGDLEQLRDCFYELKPDSIGQKGILFLLDEVQNIRGWERFARRMVEREGVRVVATGSSSRMMPQEIHTALRGRSWSVEILPFSFREYAAAHGLHSRDRNFRYGPQRALVKNRFREYLQWGGFPEVSSLRKRYEREKVLKEYLDAMFFRDLIERFRIKNIPLLDRLKERLFSSFSMKYSMTSFWKQYKDQIPFSKDSLFSYHRYFLESMLLFEVRKLSESSYQRLRNPAKVYLVDPGLARHVTSSDWGRLLENLVFLELQRKGVEIFYFEGKGECDFITRDEKGWSCYQVAWRLDEGNREREMSGLVEACRFLRLKRGTLLTSEQEGEQKAGPLTIRIQPVWKWVFGP